MIILTTGVPGAGKTLNTIRMISEDDQFQNRAIYYYGINDLQISAWTEINADQVKDWESLPDGSVVVVDECHSIFPSRSHQKEIPKFIAALKTHRHRGFDIILISQHPMDVDVAVRRNVGRHLHYDRAFGMNRSTCYEWQTVQDDPRDYHAKQEATKNLVSFKKDYFGLYHSAEVHTHSKRIPKRVYFFLGVLVLAIGGISTTVAGFDRYSESTLDTDQERLEHDQKREFPISSELNSIASAENYFELRSPRIQGMPWTAPLYDALQAEPKTYPRPQCIKRMSTGDCRCYTQQATPLDIPHNQCLTIVKRGYFDPYRDEGRAAGGNARESEAPASAGPFMASSSF